MQLLWLRDSIVEGYVATVDTVREWLMIGVGVFSDLLLEAEMRANTDEHQAISLFAPILSYHFS